MQTFVLKGHSGTQFSQDVIIFISSIFCLFFLQSIMCFLFCAQISTWSLEQRRASTLWTWMSSMRTVWNRWAQVNCFVLVCGRGSLSQWSLCKRQDSTWTRWPVHHSTHSPFIYSWGLSGATWQLNNFSRRTRGQVVQKPSGKRITQVNLCMFLVISTQVYLGLCDEQHSDLHLRWVDASLAVTSSAMTSHITDNDITSLSSMCHC